VAVSIIFFLKKRRRERKIEIKKGVIERREESRTESVF
jgi:hypothetical protein